MHLPRTFKLPISIIHKMAHNAPNIDKNKNLLLLLLLLLLPVACLLITASSPLATFKFLSLLKLDIRSKARFTKGFSEAEAGVVGIDSTKAHRDEENQPGASPPSCPF